MWKKCKHRNCYSDANCRDGYCAQHTSASRRQRAYSARAGGPQSLEPHLGIEIECYAPDSTIYRAMLAQDRIPSVDGSLPTMGCEFKLCSHTKKALRWFPQFAAKLASLGAVVNRQCGLHVHLDARGVDQRRIVDFISWLETWQQWWFGLVPPSRRNNGFCKPLRKTAAGTVISPDAHYNWVHRTGYNTVEIRIHGGTLNPHKIAGWTAVCADLMDLLRSGDPLPVIENNAPTDAQLRRIFKRAEGLAYLKTRLESNGQMGSAVQSTPRGPAVESEVV